VAAVRLAKIDCEGAEGQVVRGARETLAGRRVEFIVIEYHPAVTGHDACRAVDHELRDYGYAVTRLGSGLWVYHVPEARAALAPLGPLTAVAPL
jgi:hypothetical protein